MAGDSQPDNTRRLCAHIFLLREKRKLHAENTPRAKFPQSWNTEIREILSGTTIKSNAENETTFHDTRP